ncbi:MAG: membrane protein insertase YidC [Deltaproteobacteria bacterium]|nr:membrane protein insertase YidC [Deltaproteobacteria bacterium]
MNNQQDNTRLYLAVVLCTALIFVWQKFFMPKVPAGALPDGGEVAQIVDGGAAAPAPGATPGTPTLAANVPAPTPGAPKPPEQLVEFDSAARHLVFSSYGGVLKSAVLKGEQFKRTVDGQVEQVDLVQTQPGQALPFTTTSNGGLPAIPADLPYSVEKTDDAVTFTGKVGDLTIVKRYTVAPNGYDVALAVELRNGGTGTLAGNLDFNLGTFVKPGSEKTGGFLSRGPINQRRPIARIDTNTQRQDKNKDGQPNHYTGQLHFAGIDEQYFLLAFYPVSATPATVTLSNAEDGVRQADISVAESLAPGASSVRTYGIFTGPKLKEALETAGASMPQLKGAAPQLTQAVEYGFVEIIAVVLLAALRFLHSIVANWGADIILLTLLVKVATLPLTMKQMGQAERMRKLQPQMEAIKEKYKDDKERQNLETMKLYQQSGVNPLSGCFPLLIQLPIFWGLYRLLEFAFDIYRQPFIHGWINDLSAQDHTYVLPVLLIVSMFASQSMMPAMGDPMQQKMMRYVMPVMFGVFMLNLPAGLSLYYVFNNLLNIIQQLWLRKRYPAARPPNDGKKKVTDLAHA